MTKKSDKPLDEQLRDLADLAKAELTRRGIDTDGQGREVTGRPKRPRDANQLAKFVVDHATMDEVELAKMRERLSKDQIPGKRGSTSDDTSGKS